MTRADSADPLHYCFLWFGKWKENASSVRPQELGRELLRRGVRVTYVIDDRPENREPLPLDPAAKVVFISNHRGIRQFIARRKALRKLAPDFVHVLNPSVKAFLSLALAPGLKIVGDWDEWPAQRENVYGRLRLRVERLMDRWLRRRAVLRVVCSRYMQRRFAEEFNCQAAYVPYATYLEARAEGPSPFSAPTAVYMGNFYPNYDHDLIFAAAKLLKQEGLQPPIEFLGHGPDYEKWREFATANGLGNILMPGYVSGDALWHHLRHAHVLLFPIRSNISNLSRCPSKTYAYAQARRPVICNATGEVPATLGELSRYIDPTPQAFADAIRQAMQAPRANDVDYHVETQNWSSRADALLERLMSLDVRAGAARKIQTT